MLAALTGLLMSQLASSAIACTAMATAGAILGYLLPVFWLHRRKMQRLVALRRSLPDLLDLVVSCLDAGVTVEAVLNRIAGEEFFSKSPLGVELRTMQSEIELGATVDRAFLNFADRTDSDDVRSISTVCFQARKYGASICSALRTHADSLRDERETAAEEGIQKAAVKILAPTLLCLFPVILVVLAGPAAIQVHEKLTNSSGQTSHDR
jgi:tight adherence protein C